MDDKQLMEQHLLAMKGVCDLYLHGTIEASTAEVHKEFKDALNESLNLQNKLYTLMAEKGWYETEEAEQLKIDETKQEFEAGS